MWSAERYGYISHIARGTRIEVNRDGEFITKGRIEDIEYDEESQSKSELESESDSSESGDSDSYNYDSDEESYETDVPSEEVEI